MKSKEYWNKKILEWEKSSYQGALAELGFIEKIATKFRAPIKQRREVLLNLLKNSLKDKTVLELGCASGDLCFEFLKLGAAKVIGIDIADLAIKAAKEKAEVLNLKNRAEFLLGDVRDGIELTEADFVVGLGFIDYIDVNSLKKLFAKISGRFIFSFPENKINLINILQHLYLKSQGCKNFYKFNRRDFESIPNMPGRCYFFSKDSMAFISNFDPAGII